ncbi:MAG: hypothetical protein GX967_01050 [Clostridiales bacterium]|nr:hypothetical protein [Clostridiales bacterium]
MDGLFQTYKLVFLISVIVCIIFLIISLIMFIRFNIPKIIGNITGITAKRAVKRMREENKNREAKAGNVAQFKEEGAKTTQKFKPINNVKMAPALSGGRQIVTARLDSNNFNTANSMKPMYVTTILGNSNEEYATCVLNENGNDNFIIEQDITMIFTDEIIS